METRRGAGLSRIVTKREMIMECTNIDDSGCGQWHAIFQTADHDYCREDLPSDIKDSDAASVMARELFRRTADSTARKVVTSYRIEKW
jgi:hypothetical protein|tara:strand:+ start:157 stop:420 length:264 start_codon:yes stop_codon:yes gene_type:complete